MSALGHKQTSRQLRPMSAFTPKADIGIGPRITFNAATPAAQRRSRVSSLGRMYAERGSK